MPIIPVNYNNTVIYKIICKDNNNDIYIGSTTNFTKRKYMHKWKTEHNSGHKIHKTIRENGGFDNWDMIEIERYPCKDGNEARARERYWYDLLKGNQNMRSPSLNVEKMIENKKKYLHDYNQKMSKEMKNKKREYLKEWKQREFICECGSIIKCGNKTKHLRTEKHCYYIKK